MKNNKLEKNLERARINLYNILAETDIENSLTLTGHIPYGKIIKLYQSGGIFCLSSHVENSPNALMEAMAVGLPVVATDVGSVRDIVEDNKSGFLVEKKNVNDLAEKTSILIKDRLLYNTFAKNGREIAAKRWKPALIAKKHIAMYNELI